MKITRHLLILCALCVIGLPGCSRGGDAVPAARNELRLMTMNVWSGLDYKGTLSMGEYEPAEVRAKRFRALVAEIRKLSPDVITINEANFLPDYIENLAGEIGYDYIYHVGVSGVRVWRAGLPWNLREGDAILAKKDLRLACVEREQLSGGGFIWNNLSFHTQDATQVLLGKIRVNDDDVYIAATHWHASPPDNARSLELLSLLKKEGNYPDTAFNEAKDTLKSDCLWRRDEAGKMSSFLKKKVPAGKKIIVMGDFNSTAGTPEMRQMLSAGFIDTYAAVSRDEGYTWDAVKNSNIKKFYVNAAPKMFDSLYEEFSSKSDGRSSRIDFILLNREFSRDPVRASSVCCTGYLEGVQPSDHFGVFSIVTMK
jgi:endonuclease/exonuclease/phosphatase family metal-dependent hydrolase